MGLLEQAKGILRSIDTPTRASFHVVPEGDGRLNLRLETAVSELCANFQETHAAAPSYALAIAHRLTVELDVECSVKIVVSGETPEPRTGDWRHWNRSLFLLAEFENALGRRFSVDAPDRWRWPTSPVMNFEDSSRERSEGTKREDTLEVSLSSNVNDAVKSFQQVGGEVERFFRQLPVGLFDGDKGNDTRWTPGGSSGVDLWALSKDEATFHLFELKALKPGKSASLGILPETYYYARLLHYVRCGLDSGAAIGSSDGAQGLGAVRKSKRTIAWLAANHYHPLLWREHRSPLEWLNAAYAAEGLEFRILPVDIEEDGTFRGWRLDQVWPGGRLLP